MNPSDYPENRLNIMIDENGNVSYRQDPAFLKYYVPTAEELEEELRICEENEDYEQADEIMKKIAKQRMIIIFMNIIIIIVIIICT